MLNFGLSLLISIGTFILLLSAVIFFKHLLKKSTIKEYISLGDYISLDNIIRFGVYLLLMIVFLIIIHLSFSTVNFLPILWVSIFTSLAVLFIPFTSLINKIRSKEFKTINFAKVVGFTGAIVFLVLEVACFSNIGIKKETNAVNIPFKSSFIVSTTGDDRGSYLEFYNQRGNIVIDNRELKMESLYLDLSSKVETKLQIDISISDDNNSFAFKKSYAFDPRNSLFEYFNMKDYQDSKYIMITFVIDETNLYSVSEISSIQLHQISVNKAFPFTFNPLRYSLLTGLFIGVVLIFKKGKNIKLKEVDTLTLLKRIALIATGAIFVYLIINSFIYSYNHYVLVNSINDNSPIYYQLFAALKKGQFHLDITPSEKLLALENPYDPNARSGVSYLWDHAFYNGKYYCYYGMAPGLLVMFPAYLMSGFQYTASMLFIEEIGTLFSILGFVLLVIELVRIFFKKINLPVLIFTLIAGIFSSMLLSNTIYKVGYFYEGIYRIPYSYGLAFLFLTLYFLLMAYQNQRLRILNLALVGLMVVLLVMSRPTLIFGMLLVVPLFIKIIIEKYPLKKKIIDFVPMAVIVISGAIFVMIYNYQRFDSILEFGQSYQLTVTDNTKLAYSIKGLLPTFCNFYILPPDFAGEGDTFPLIQYGYLDFTTRYHSYNAGGIGLLFFPLFWSIIALPFIFDKKDDLWVRIMLYVAPFVIFFLAFNTYCFAGYCPRYIVELTAISAVVGIIATLKIFEKLYQKNQLGSLIGLMIILLVASFVPINLLFYGFDGWREADNHSLLEMIRSIFNQYNI